MSVELTPVDWAKRPILEKYADFTGRASRPEFWWYVLAVVVAFIIVSIVQGIVGLGHMFGRFGLLTGLLWLATIVPNLAVTARRLHDTNRSGWWILVPVVPYVLGIVLGGAAMMGSAAVGSGVGMMAGAGIAGIFLFLAFIADVVLIVFCAMPGQPGDNRYGPPPAIGGNIIPAE